MREVVFPIFLFNVWFGESWGRRWSEAASSLSHFTWNTHTRCWSRGVLIWTERFCCELLFERNSSRNNSKPHPQMTPQLFAISLFISSRGNNPEKKPKISSFHCFAIGLGNGLDPPLTHSLTKRQGSSLILPKRNRNQASSSSLIYPTPKGKDGLKNKIFQN